MMPALYKAIAEDGDSQRVVQLLQDGADPNSNYYGITALMEASRRGFKEMVIALLDAGADAQRTRGEDESAILFAQEQQRYAQRDGRHAEAAKYGEIIDLLQGNTKPAKFSASGEIQRAQRTGEVDPAEGLNILDHLLGVAPGAGMDGAFNLYGQLCMKLGDLVTAKDAFERDIAARPSGDVSFSWLYLALATGLQGDERRAHDFAAKAGGLRIDHEFANTVREAYIAWLRNHGRMPSRLSQARSA